MSKSTITRKSYEISNRLSLLSSWLDEHNRHVEMYTAREIETRKSFETYNDEFYRKMADNLKALKDESIAKRQEVIDEWNSIIADAILTVNEEI